MNISRSFGRCLLVLSILVAAPLVARAQGEQNPPPPQSSSAQTSSQDTSQDQSWNPFAGQSTTSSLDTGQTVSQANSNRISPLQWGHLSLASADMFYAYDSNYKFSATGSEASEAFAARLLALYSIGTERTAFDLQYRPSVLLSPEGSSADVIGSLLSLHAFRRIGSRWFLGAMDRFSYAPDRDRFIDGTISPNFGSGNVEQQSFIVNGFNELRESAQGLMAYRLTFRDSITLHSEYDYVDLTRAFETNSPAGNNYNSTNSLGAGINWTHALSAYHEIGAAYNYDRTYVAGLPGSTEYHSWLLTYGQWIQPTLRLMVEVGPSLGIYSEGRSDATTVRGSASLIKMFHESRVAALYSRDYDYVGLPTSNYHNRADAFYSRNIGPRWELSGGGGYLSTHSASNAEVQGRNLWIGGRHNFNAHWALFLSFANAAVGPPSVSRNFITAGVHWAAEEPSR